MSHFHSSQFTILHLNALHLLHSYFYPPLKHLLRMKYSPSCSTTKAGLLSCCTTSSPIARANPPKAVPCISRRVGLITISTSLLLTTEANLSDKTANSLDLNDFRMTVPDQTVEEAESVVEDHAQGLLDVKTLLDSESWRDAQLELRRNSSYLKQDFYTIIQSKEGSSRPLLRRLYAKLFNNVTKLDYAARDKDVARVQECYDNVAAALKEFLSRL